MISKKRILWLIILAVIIVAGALMLLLLPIDEKKSEDPGVDNNPPAPIQSAEEVSLAINPCNLLSDEERSGLGLGQGEENDRRDKGDLAYRECDWRSDALQVGATIFPSGSLKTAQRWEGVTPEPLTIGTHKAQIALAPLDRTTELIGSRTCQLDIQLDISGGTSQVRLRVNIPKDTSPRSCDIAKQVADFIAPRLPNAE